MGIHVEVEDPGYSAEPRSLEVDLDFPREWLEFIDPDDVNHLIHADLTWLLSNWTCIYGRGCHGIEGREEEGCCSAGAFFTDEDDRERVRAAANKLTPEHWQYYQWGFERYTEMGTPDGKNQVLRTATRLGGGCVFRNDPGFPGGGGCALHVQALRDGVHPLEYKPDVCWQLPIRRDRHWWQRWDGAKVFVSTLGEFDRRSWGEGGSDLHWWCSSSREAHAGAQRLYEAYEPELTAMIGTAAYARLAELCAARADQGMIAPHPATTAARKLIPIRPV
jgi:hypothetical protein